MVNGVRLVVWGTCLLALCFCLLTSSCGLMRRMVGSSGGGQEEPAGGESPKGDGSRFIGEVVSVHLDEGFVLIRRYGGGGLPEDFEYFTRSVTGEAASLRPTGERAGRFYAADIGGGTPTAGDFVIGRPLAKGAAAPSVPTQEPQKQGLNFP